MEFNNANIASSGNTTVEEVKKTVIIGLPGDTFSSKFLVSWTNTLSYLWKQGKYNFIVSTGVNSFVPFARMQTLGLNVMRGCDQKPFDGLQYDVYMTIDSDVIFTAEQVIELIESTEKHPVVSGMYRMADLTNFAVVKDWDISYFVKNGSFQFVTQELLDNWKKETDLKFMPVDYVGLGFFACRKEVLDKMKYPYFDGEVKEIVLENGTKIRDISSEDVCFCKNIAKAGYNIFLNTDIRVGHLKPLVI